MSIVCYIQECASRVEQYFQGQFNLEHVPKVLKDSMAYSFLAGGKRLRPALAFAANEAVGGNPAQCVPVATAIEMIHTYSLIHDDLPAMDNDDYRRGKPTNHIIYGEAMAILAGDGLLTHAFYVASKGSRIADIHADTLIRMIEDLSFYAGVNGMVGGQVKDLLGEKGINTRDELESIHKRKTGDLIVCSLRCGAMSGGASEESIEALTQYGYLLGLAFQIQDDVLDVIGDEEIIGKPIGSDAKLSKATYPALIGLDESKRQVDLLMDEAKAILADAGWSSSKLMGITDYILTREK